MLLQLIPLVGVSITTSNAVTAADDMAMAERRAQVRLADLLGSADSIDEVHGHGHVFTFFVERADASGSEAPFAIVATTGDAGIVIDVAEHARVARDMDLGGLSWLGDTMQETVAVTALAVDEDGAVTLTTADGERYMAIPGRGSGGAGSDAEVDARWAAEFDNS